MVKRIAVIGPKCSGKTKLIEKYVKKRYSPTYMSTLVSDVVKDSENNIIWDTPSNPRFIGDVQLVLKKSAGVILCFCPSVPESFHQALALIEGFDKPFVIAATKADIKPFCIRDEWSSEARVRRVKIIRTSAVNGGGVSQVFKEIYDLVPDEKEIVLSSLEYTTQQLGSCINYGVSYIT